MEVARIRSHNTIKKKKSLSNADANYDGTGVKV